MSAAKDVLKLMKDKEVKFVDLRFTDTRGKEQHVSMPASIVDEDMFTDGKMFDGSSIAGWKASTSPTWCSCPIPPPRCWTPSPTRRA